MFSIDEDDIQTLVKLGLNTSQAKIYLTLISLGTANAKKIAQTAKIDNAGVYRQIESLQKKALVEKIIDFPNSYKPLSLSKTLKILIEEKNRKNIEIQKKAKALLQKEAQIDTDKEEEYKISIIPQKEYLIQYVKGACERVEKEWLWYTQIERIPIVITKYYDQYKKALDRGISWRTIAEVNKPTNQVIQFIQKYCEENPNFTIRFVNPTLLVTFGLRDGIELDYFTEISKGVADSQALYTNNVKLTKMIKEYFELKWDTGMTECPKKEQ